MRIIKIISFVGLLAMTGILIFGFLQGDFSIEGEKILNMPWGIVSLVDLYVGFSLFSCWIVYRERSLWRSFLWVFFMMILGFWTGALYTFIAAVRSKGDWQIFFKGSRV